MTESTVTEITADEAVGAVTAAAFTIEEPHEGAGRTIIHSFLGPVGADMDLDRAIELIRSARRIAWAYNPFGHELYVETAEGKIYCLDVKRPAP